MQEPGRIGDYLLDGELTAMPGERAYVASHVVLPRQARIVLPEHALPELAARVVREACILEALSHPGVPRIFECGLLPDRQSWIAMELVDGPTLADRIAQLSLPVLDIVYLVRDIADILHHAEGRGIVHANISARTIVFRDDNTPCLVEWGAARLYDSPTAPVIVRERVYRAPEQLQGATVDGKADIYALGVIAHQALSRVAPTLPVHQRGVSNALTTLIDRMLAEDPAERPSAADVRLEATGIAELFFIPDLEPDPTETELARATEVIEDDNDSPIDVEELDLDELVELAEWTDTPALPSRRIGWTPAAGYSAVVPDGVALGTIPPRRRRDL